MQGGTQTSSPARWPGINIPKKAFNLDLKTKHYISRLNTESFSSALQAINPAENAEIYSDRVQNQIVWIDHKPGDLIFAQHTRNLLSAINAEVQARNEALKNNPNYRVQEYYNTSKLVRQQIADSKPLEHVQSIYSQYLSDGMVALQLPKEIKNLESSDMLVIAYRTAFCRLPYNLINSAVAGDAITLSLKQAYNYFNDSRGTNPETNTKFEDLKALTNLLKTNPSKRLDCGVIGADGNIHWFNNLKVSKLSFNEYNTIIGDLTERPADWTESIGEDLNTTIGGNLQYAKSRTQVLSKPYEENIEWQSVQKTYAISITLEYNQEIESLVDEYLQGALITAQRLNKFKEYANKLSSACICNCNYCTCDCNYCTCDCNYCTCNCNYCTCNCNYCTCNCNYKYIESGDSAKQYPTITQFTRNICTCDANRKEYNRYGEYGYIGWAAACPTNREYVLGSDGAIWMAPVANVSLDCVCNANTVENKFKTPFLKDISSNEQFVKTSQDDVIPDSHPSFSTAETYGDGKFVDTRKQSSYYQICVCDVNTKLVDAEQTYYDTQEYYSCTCNADKNPISGEPMYKFALNSKFKNEGFVAGKNLPQGKKTIKYKTASCPSNREIKYLVDWTQFWNATTHKAGAETAGSANTANPAK